MKEIADALCTTAAKLASEGFLSEGGSLSIRKGAAMVTTPPEADFSTLNADDLIVISIEDGSLGEGGKASPAQQRHMAIYRDRSDITALVHTSSSSVLCCSKAGETVKPMLDDMAQIVGTSIRTAPAGASEEELSVLCSAMKKRNTVFIRDGGALCGAGSLDDAHAVCQVSEKACQAWVESWILGGGHKISALESALMRFVYLKKYSKQAEKNI